MARINSQLLDRLQTKLGLSQSRVYALIDQKMRELSVPRDVAAISLASERGIGIARFADASQLAELRQARAGSAAGAVTIPPVVAVARKIRAPARAKSAKRAVTRSRGVATSVFVVHGRNINARNELFRFLRALHLQPLEWNQVIAMTGEPSPYVGTILDTAFREAAAVVVLFTPDDEAKLRKKYWKTHERSYEKRLMGQARPNVLFEAGMAFGRNPNRTLLVQLGEMREFSDIGGRHVVHLSNAVESRRELSTKLKNAGCAVNEDGTDWLSEGDLTL
jgi:predicted nucleotide-binding protein